jgi:hypothetical protein
VWSISVTWFWAFSNAASGVSLTTCRSEDVRDMAVVYQQ